MYDLTIAATYFDQPLRAIEAQLANADAAMAASYDIDWITGAVAIPNPAAIFAAFQRVAPGPRADLAAAYFARMMSDGIAVLARDNDHNQGYAIPWRALTSTFLLKNMPSSAWSSLGIEPWQSVQTAKASLNNRFGNIPPYILDPERLSTFIDYAARAAWVERLGGGWDTGAFGLRQRDPVDGPDLDDIGDVGGPSRPKGPVGSVVDFLADLIAQAAGCLLNSQWTIVDYGTVRICMNRACADLVEQVLTLGGGAKLGAAVLAGIKAGAQAGIQAGLGAAIGSAGGWAGLVIAAIAWYWATWISHKKGPNGVCIIHFAPWHWKHLLTGIPGYAEPHP
jgi:hypothetical protein